jgi:hypothetical protein
MTDAFGRMHALSSCRFGIMPAVGKHTAAPGRSSVDSCDTVDRRGLRQAAAGLGKLLVTAAYTAKPKNVTYFMLQQQLSADGIKARGVSDQRCREHNAVWIPAAVHIQLHLEELCDGVGAAPTIYTFQHQHLATCAAAAAPD